MKYIMQFVAAIISPALTFTIRAWCLLIGLGVVWHEYGVGRPVGFGACLGLAVLLELVPGRATTKGA